jgi:hypothetical protein
MPERGCRAGEWQASVGEVKKRLVDGVWKGYAEGVGAGEARSAVEMPESPVRRDVVGTRREGRRSLAAYNAQARGLRDLVESERPGQARPGTPAPRLQPVRTTVVPGNASDFSAGVALALVYPLMRRMRMIEAGSPKQDPSPRSSGNEGASMKRKPSIKSLDNVSLDEAIAYLDYWNGDPLNAAHALAVDRARLDGSNSAPDDAEVHHALFLLCRARGENPPSFDQMRVELRRRLAA